MPSARCPRCTTIVPFAAGSKPSCPACGFGGQDSKRPTAQPAASSGRAPSGPPAAPGRVVSPPVKPMVVGAPPPNLVPMTTEFARAKRSVRPRSRQRANGGASDRAKALLGAVAVVAMLAAAGGVLAWIVLAPDADAASAAAASKARPAGDPVEAATRSVAALDAEASAWGGLALITLEGDFFAHGAALRLQVKEERSADAFRVSSTFAYEGDVEHVYIHTCTPAGAATLDDGELRQLHPKEGHACYTNTPPGTSLLATRVATAPPFRDVVPLLGNASVTAATWLPTGLQVTLQGNAILHLDHEGRLLSLERTTLGQDYKVGFGYGIPFTIELPEGGTRQHAKMVAQDGHTFDQDLDDGDALGVTLNSTLDGEYRVSDFAIVVFVPDGTVVVFPLDGGKHQVRHGVQLTLPPLADRFGPELTVRLENVPDGSTLRLHDLWAQPKPELE